MGLLLNKMYEMKRHPQQYHPKSQKFFPHPAGKRPNKGEEIKKIQDGNNYLIKKLEDRLYINGPYCMPNFEKSFQKHLYYRQQILNSGARKNPYLHFATPKEFQRSFYTYMDNMNNRNRFMTNRTPRFRSVSAFRLNNSNTSNNRAKSNYIVRSNSALKKEKPSFERIQIDANDEL